MVKHSMKLYKQLRKYFKNTSEEQLNKYWEEIKHLNKGVNVITWAKYVRKNIKP